ncbi:MAG: hypothetical protein C0591_03885 [Marinilabiliales bacterium]|nr:MAG: hypothetical protein C0591_03885 [Marinilabiliales bacterium]
MIRKTILVAFTAILLIACQENKFKLQYDHQNVLYIEKSAIPELEINESVYVPAYSDLYYESQQKKTFFTVILSLRNISFTDTLYFTNIDYYNSHGKLLRKYIDQVLVLRPMESMEYIVEEAEKEGGTGANFVVGYSAKANLKNHPFIESIMMGNLDNYRFAFTSPGVRINK